MIIDDRMAQAVPCPECQGFADRVETTAAEDKLGCGRHDCCYAAFVCRKCGKRFGGHLPAPEME